MIDNLPKYVDFLTKTGLNSNQFLFLNLIYNNQYSLIYKYCNEGRGFTADDLEKLEKDQWVVNVNASKADFYHDGYLLTPKFSDAMLIEPEDSASQVWVEYPSFILINFKKMPAKNMDPDEFAKLYNRKIGKSKLKHERVIRALKYAKKNDMICMGIEKWMKSDQWKEIEKEMTPDDKDKKHGREEF